MSMLASRNRFIAAAAIGAATVAIAACSSSNTSTGSANTQSTSSTSSSTSSSSAYPKLASYINSLEARPTSINITQAIGKAVPKGKTIAYIQCGSPACVVNGDALQQAASVLDWKVTRINAGLTAETIQSAWQQAVSDHPDAVITSGFARALFNPQLAQLKAANIPVIDLTTADPPGDGLTAVYGYGPQWTTQGKILADYMLVNSGGKPINVLSVSVSAYPNLTLIANAVTSEIKANCSSCTEATLDVPVTSIGSDLPSRITSYLSAHPNVNWVYVGFADMLSGVPASLSSAGLSNVKIVTIDRTTATEEYMKAGQSLVMTAGFDVAEMMWRSVDYLARLWTGTSTAQNTAVDGLPLWIQTKANQPAGAPTTGYYPYVANYPELYKQLWGVK
jgi:ribose transport system substrate-binding protein